MELVDKALIGRKFAEMDTYLNQIKDYSNIDIKTYRDDWKIQRIVERTLHMLIELCIDIANHIISDKKMRIPTSYADTFKVLLEHNIIENELYKTMEKMAKFRNIIVHQYEGIDPEIVVAILHKNLAYFDNYKKSLLKTLLS